MTSAHASRPQPRSQPGRFLLWLLAFLALSALLLEGLARSLVRPAFPAASLGVGPVPTGSNFEIKWYRLQQYVAANGGVDVLLVGSSVVNTGLDPDVIAQTYTGLTGQKLRVFNFGVEGLDIVPNSVYARILVEAFHPRLLIFGTIPRDYLAADNLEVNSAFLSSPWIEYRSGAPNPAGWLIEHSLALQAYLPYRDWMRSDFPTLRADFLHRILRTSPSGYEPDNNVATNVEQHPSPDDPNETAAFAKYADYRVDPGRLASLQAILDLQTDGTHVLVMNIPAAASFYDYMGGAAVYRDYEATLSARVNAAGGIFLSSEDAPPIPANGYSDREHLNYMGAPVLSAYLGAHLADLAKADGSLFAGTGQGGR